MTMTMTYYDPVFLFVCCVTVSSLTRVVDKVQLPARKFSNVQQESVRHVSF